MATEAKMIKLPPHTQPTGSSSAQATPSHTQAASNLSKLTTSAPALSTDNNRNNTSNTHITSTRSSADIVTSLLKNTPTVTAKVESSQALNARGQQLLNQVNPSLFHSLNANTANKPSTHSASATNTSLNHPSTLYLSKLLINKQLLTVIGSEKLVVGGKVLINNHQQQLNFTPINPTTPAHSAAIQLLRQALPQQQSASQLLNTVNTLLKLPHTIQQQLFNKTVLDQLQHLTSVTLNKNQTGLPQQVKNAINNSGIFLETKLNTQKNIKNDFSHALANIDKTLKSLSKPNNINGHINKPTNINQNHIPTNEIKATEKQAINHILKDLNITSQASDVKGKKLENLLVTLLHSNHLQTPIHLPTKLASSHLGAQFNSLLQLLGIKVINSESHEIKFSKELIAKKLNQLINGVQDKIRLNQIRSLGLDSGNHETPAKGTQLNTEIPLRWGEQILPLHLEIKEHHDRAKHQAEANHSDEKETAKRWQAFLSFDLPNNEKLHTQITLINSSLSAVVWAESHTLCEQAKKNIKTLRKNLTDNGVIVEDITCIEGKPPTQELSLDYNLVDIST